MQSAAMDSNWAADHLQVIRTLMERAAVYRRALAPIMLTVGAVGCVAAGLALTMRSWHDNRAFALIWMVAAAISVALSYLLVRRQALKDQDPFWSPPTRRVTQALVPGFLAGAAAGLVFVAGPEFKPVAWLLAIGWVLCYGCALHAAGFFMQRGIKLFGLCFVVAGSVLLLAISRVATLQTGLFAHATMGLFFGVLHLAYGAYLHWTERPQDL
jgi:hypothetical protein